MSAAIAPAINPWPYTPGVARRYLGPRIVLNHRLAEGVYA